MAKKTPKTKVRKTAPCPNKPSFDFDPSTGKPNLQADETILVAKEKSGVPVYITSQGRVIYACSLDTFEEKFNPLLQRANFEAHFPHALDKVKAFKVAASK